MPTTRVLQLSTGLASFAADDPGDWTFLLERARAADRGRLLDHTLAVLQTIWTEPRATFADELLSFEAIHAMPKPRPTHRLAQPLERMIGAYPRTS
jgi:alkanesulfonate monooxygenase SsuD/methylene tetrahydromethanopterin reductase-like flavin-dependent oxidoreductase (luciferase family)